MLTLRATLSIRAATTGRDFDALQHERGGEIWRTGRIAGGNDGDREFPRPAGLRPLIAERRPVPVPGPEEVLIKVAAASRTGPMFFSAWANIRRRPGHPTSPGWEWRGPCGRRTGADMLWGRKVCALLAGGGYAEYAVAPAGQCLPVRTIMTWVETAALPKALFHRVDQLFRAYAVGGDTVLVHGGTSGIEHGDPPVCSA